MGLQLTDVDAQDYSDQPLPPLVPKVKKPMGLALTQADVGRKFLNQGGEIGVLERSGNSPTHPFGYRTPQGRYHAVTATGHWSAYPERNTDLDLVARVTEEPKQLMENDMPGQSMTGDYNPKLFVTKDSGKRESYSSGMVRDTAANKMRPDLVKDGPMFLRWVGLMTRGAIKYAARNWMKASGQEEYERFVESADRHYEIWSTWRKYGVNIEDLDNPTTEPLKEDHAAAVFFNVNGAEYVADKNPAIKTLT